MDKKKGDKPVEGQILSYQTLTNELSVTGAIASYDEVELKNEVSGRIVKLNLPEGKTVRKGTLLVKLFDDDLQAVLRKLKAQLAQQEQLLKRQTELIKVNGISRNDYEQTQLQVNTLRADIDAEKALIRKTEVLAPFDGVIGLRNVSEGAVVTNAVVLATLRSNRLKLDFTVPEKYSPGVQPGMDVQFNVASGRLDYHARVFASEKGIDADTRNLRVRALINGNGKDLIPGAFATVRLRLGENSKALMVPAESLIPKEREKQVIVAHGGKAHFVTVQTGIRKESTVEILNGLQVGDTLVTSGILFLKEGADLKFSHLNTRL